MFGEHFWSNRIAERHAKPVEYEDARSKFGVPSNDFNLFARVHTTKSAWRHTAKTIVLDLMAASSSKGVAPPWDQVSAPLAKKLLKDHFGYQKAYYFLDLLDMREDSVVNTESKIKELALHNGELLYDEWLKVSESRSASCASTFMDFPAY